MRHLICWPSSDADARQTPGSRIGFCSACQEPVWVSVAGQLALVDDPELKKVCVECGMALHADDDDPEFMAAPGALDELERVEGKEAVQFAQVMLGRLNRAARRRRHH